MTNEQNNPRKVYTPEQARRVAKSLRELAEAYRAAEDYDNAWDTFKQAQWFECLFERKEP